MEVVDEELVYESPLLLVGEVVTVKDQGGNGRGGKWKWCREHCLAWLG